MTKAELIALVAARSRVPAPEAERALETALAVIAESLAAGGEVRLPGFGRFHVGTRGARRGVDPRTGASIWVDATTVPRFTAGSGLKRAVRDQ